MEKQNLCKVDNRPADIGHIFCDSCLNSWLKIRVPIQQMLTAKYGEVTRLNNPQVNGEMNRLSTLWKRDREAFEDEARSWFA